MVHLRWIASLLWMPFFWRDRLPLIRPSRIDWNPSLIPQTLQIKGHTIFYAVRGEGFPILLLHGYGAGMWVWEKQIDLLSQFYRVYALDLIGHGFSDRPKISYTPNTYLHFLKDFMDGVGIKKAILIGNSMGGGLAWAMAGLFPERVEKLILINAVPPDVLEQVKNESFRALVAIKEIPLLPYLVFASRNRNSIRWILFECVSNIQLITPEVVERQYKLSKIKGSTWVLYSTFKNAKYGVKLKDCLRRISQPTLLIWGDSDQVLPLSIGKELHRIISHSRLLVIKKGAHIPMWENSEEVNQAILDFLKKGS